MALETFIFINSKRETFNISYLLVDKIQNNSRQLKYSLNVNISSFIMKKKVRKYSLEIKYFNKIRMSITLHCQQTKEDKNKLKSEF